MHRRLFIKVVAGSAAAWAFAARAQQAERVRRIGVLIPFTAGDPEVQVRNTVFEQSLRQLGWTVGQNLQIEQRLSGGEAASIRRAAAELVALGPDVLLVIGNTTASLLLQATQTIPVVFVNMADPVGAGFVQSLARPGGNATGFTSFEYSLSGKWIELLKQIAPQVTRVAVLRDHTQASGIGQFSAIQTVAQSLGVELTPLGVRNTDEIERDLAVFARAGNGGMIVTSGGIAYHRNLVIRLAASHKLPAIYPFRYYAVEGGLMSYGPDTKDPIRNAAAYVDRILKGEKPADMPVQAPTKFELVINLKTAKALDLTVTPALLARANEVIE
jgi:putative tryptophan/tyrosine transport system substrate-binding protein